MSVDSGNRRPDMADQVIPLAQAHPTEMWATLGIMGAGLVGLIGVLYKRINTDIDGAYDDQTQLRDDFESTHEKTIIYTSDQIEKLKTDINGIGRELSRIGQQAAQFATASTFTNEEMDRLEADIKDLNKRLMTIEVEHKHCLNLHGNLLQNNHQHRNE
jgi:septal ring factor EnvC (AmiA/AmiB activator)